MDFISEQLLNYSQNFSDEENEVLKDLNRQTYLKINQPRMLSGHLQGRLLSFLSKIKQPNYILEIGTYTGYSALCLAEGLTSEGKLVTIDPNEETNLFAKEFIGKTEFKHKIEVIQGNAQTIIPTLNHKWDMVFIDADKINYSTYYNLIINDVNKGGLIIADNVLWSGKVLQSEKDKDTAAIHQFNEMIKLDKRVEKVLLPVRDGLLLIRKI